MTDWTISEFIECLIKEICIPKDFYQREVIGKFVDGSKYILRSLIDEEYSEINKFLPIKDFIDKVSSAWLFDPFYAKYCFNSFLAGYIADLGGIESEELHNEIVKNMSQTENYLKKIFNMDAQIANKALSNAIYEFYRLGEESVTYKVRNIPPWL